MVNVLPGVQRKPSFGEIVGAGLGQGAAQGFSNSLAENQQMKQRQKLIEQIEGPKSSSSAFSEQLKGAIPQIEQQLGFKLTPEQIDSIGMQLQGNYQQPQSEEPSLERAKQYAAIGEHDLSNIAAKEAELGMRKIEKKAELHNKISSETLSNAAKKAEALPQKEIALQNMIDAIEAQDMGFFSPDNLANVTGIEGLRSAKGSEFLTAGKEFFLGSLQRAGARPNQWIEQQISTMLPKVGRSQEANLSVAEMLKTELDVEKKQLELTNELADELEARYGYVPRDLAERVRKQMVPYAREKQKQLQEDLMKIQEEYTPKNKEGILMYHPSGELRRVPHDDFKEAKNNGYRIYKE